MAAVLADAPHREDRLRKDDRLLLAIACSLALHFAILSVLPGFLEPRPQKAREPKALTARLVAPNPQPARAAEPPAPVPEQPLAKPVRPAPPKPHARAHPRPPVVPPVMTTPPTPTAPPVAVVPAPEPAPPPKTAPVAPATPPAASGAPGATATVAAAPDLGSVAQFRVELIEMAKRYKRYPRVAVDNNWEGKVDLRMVVAANGQIASLSIRKSAGYSALDEEAKQMFRAAKDQLAVPPSLRGKQFTVDISADFYFRE